MAGRDPRPPRAAAGCTVLSLIARPLCVPILRAHADGPLRLPDLRDRIVGASPAILRGQVEKLRGVGALERRVRKRMPYTVENELTATGREILELAEVAAAWLDSCPRGAIALGTEAAKSAIGALVKGWDSAIPQSLATGPLSLTELSSAIPSVSYPSLERRLAAMRTAGLVEGLARTSTPGTPYAITDWTRDASRLLTAAGRWEREHMASTANRIAPASGTLMVLDKYGEVL